MPTRETHGLWAIGFIVPSEATQKYQSAYRKIPNTLVFHVNTAGVDYNKLSKRKTKCLYETEQIRLACLLKISEKNKN